MKTITHEEYLALNAVIRDGYKDESKIADLKMLKSKGWIQRCAKTEWELYDRSTKWEPSSTGRLEHNLYEKIYWYTDGCKRKKATDLCPRCQNSDQNCPICKGYTVDGGYHSLR